MISKENKRERERERERGERREKDSQKSLREIMVFFEVASSSNFAFVSRYLIWLFPHFTWFGYVEKSVTF